MFDKFISILCFVACGVCGGIVGICAFNLDVTRAYFAVVLTIMIVNSLLAGLAIFLGLKYHEDWLRERRRYHVRKVVGRMF